MDLRHVLIVIGTRPEAIKMIPVLRELRARGLRVTACSSGQHRDMLAQAMESFGERCDVDLDLMAHGQDLTTLTSRILLSVQALLERLRPDALLVHGDTVTAMAAAMAAFYARVPVFHVEAGLRSHDPRNPWPEEFHRVAIDAMASLLFAPTEGAAATLRAELHAPERVVVTGNTGIDALLSMARRLDADPASRARLAAALPALVPGRRIVLATAHRRESLGEGLTGICDALLALAARGDVEIVYPLHPNPDVASQVRRRLEHAARLHLVPPLGYAGMVDLMRRACLLLTDSGGLQEEAPRSACPSWSCAR